MRSARNFLIGILLILTMGIVGCEGEKKLPILGLKDISETGDTLYHQIPDFALLDQDSVLITQQTVAGKIYVADFFFTSCPSICPKMSEQMLRLHDALLGENRVVLISHTIDPTHDTVAVLREYANALGVNSAKWHMLTGEQETIYDLGMEYMVPVGEDPDAPGGYMHSGAFILLDANRRVRGYYDGTNPEEVDQLLQDIGILLEEVGTDK